MQFIGNLAGLPAGPGLTLPGNLQLTASGAGTDADPAKIQLATTAPIGTLRFGPRPNGMTQNVQRWAQPCCTCTKARTRPENSVTR